MTIENKLKHLEFAYKHITQDVHYFCWLKTEKKKTITQWRRSVRSHRIAFAARHFGKAVLIYHIIRCINVCTPTAVRMTYAKLLYYDAFGVVRGISYYIIIIVVVTVSVNVLRKGSPKCLQLLTNKKSRRGGVYTA